MIWRKEKAACPYKVKTFKKVSIDHRNVNIMTEEKTGQTRRNFLKSGAAAASAAVAGCLGGDGDSNPEYLPNFDEESFKREVDQLIDELDEAENEVSQASENFEGNGFSTDPKDYTGRGFEVTDNFRVAVPEDSQSFTIPAEQEGDSRDFEWLDGTDSIDSSAGSLVNQIDEEVGLSDKDRERIANDDLVSAAANMVPYVRSSLNEDGSSGQPMLSDGEIEEYQVFMQDVISAEEAYKSALRNLGDSARELGQEGDNLKGAETSGTDDYNKDVHFTVGEAEEMRNIIETEEDRAQDVYEEAVSEYAVIKAFRHAGEQLGNELDRAQDVYEEGSFDETGEPRDGSGGQPIEDDPLGEYGSLFEGRNCDWGDEYALDVREELDSSGYEPSELSVTGTETGALEVVSSDGEYSKILNC